MRQGFILMMPSMLYAQGWVIKDDEIWTYCHGEEGEVETDGEMLDFLNDPDEHVECVTKEEFIMATVSAYIEHHAESDYDHDYTGPALSLFNCKVCGAKVLDETDPTIDYPFYCLNCDENYYEFEVTQARKILMCSMCDTSHTVDINSKSNTCSPKCVKALAAKTRNENAEKRKAKK